MISVVYTMEELLLRSDNCWINENSKFCFRFSKVWIVYDISKFLFFDQLILAVNERYFFFYLQYGSYQRKQLVEDLNKKWNRVVLNISVSYHLLTTSYFRKELYEIDFNSCTCSPRHHWSTVSGWINYWQKFGPTF